jgi:cell division protein FtsB
VQQKIQKLRAVVKKYQLDDPRTWGLIVFGFMAAAVTWSGAKAIQLNFELQKKVVGIEEQNKVQQLQNETQKLKNEYFKTDEYRELAARRLFGKAAPGERVYVIPKDIAMKYVSPDTAVPVVAKAENPLKLPSYQQNLQDWLDFFFHRTPSN